MNGEVLCISLLGTFSVARDDDVVADDAWRLRKAKTLIKLLALSPERRLHADQAAETLWPGRDPEASRNNLHQVIFSARRALDSVGLDGHRYVELSDDLISLAPRDPLQIDVLAFEQAAATAREEGTTAAYGAALAAYHGEMLPEDRYEEWTAARRGALQELRLGLGVELAELEAAEDRTAAIGRLREVLVEAPLHEPAHRALMRLYADAGRRQEALAQFHELKRGLRREFEDEPDAETRRLYRELLTRSEEPEAEPGAADREGSGDGGDTVRSRLPRQLTSFIGRERELAEVAALLRGSRLVTLTGPGGCGKTRLAYELAAQQSASFADGVWPVELAALGDPELIGPAFAQALDTRLASDRPAEIALASHIGDRQQLLLVDNCEHLVEPVARLVETLLHRCPRLVVLATSRERLRVPGEVAWRVPSLSLPRLGDEAVSAEALEAESVRLFAARAGEVASGFEVDGANAAAVAALCHRLDGIPLAIELAAARVGVLSPEQIVARLDGSLDLLSAGSRTAMTRQQTLRATLAWSFDLLDAEERVLMQRLSAFAGSFDVEAAEEVCAGDPLGRDEVVAVFGRLIDKSLVHVEDGSEEPRFFLLETVRQFAAEQLDRAGERAELERRHRSWYLALAEADSTSLEDLPPRERLRQLDGERDNLRAALASALADDPETGLRLACALWRFWLMRGYLAEAYRWLVAMLSASPAPTEVRARALLATCLISVRRGVYGRIHEFGTESVAIFAELGDPGRMFDAIEVSAAHRVIAGAESDVEALLAEHESAAVEHFPEARARAWAAQTRGIAAWLRRDYVRARAELETTMEELRGIGSDPRAALWPLSYGLISGESEFGYPFLFHEDTVVVARRVGGETALAYVLINLAAIDRVEGRPADAQARAEESLARFRRLRDKHGEAYALNALGNLARSEDDFETGHAHLVPALRLRREMGDRRGNGITLGCLAALHARAGDPDGGRALAEQSRRWFAANDDLIGLSAAEISLACVALCAEDPTAARSHLQTAAAVIEGMESSHQEGWAFSSLAALAIESGDRATAGPYLERATQSFAGLGSETGIAYCQKLAADPSSERGATADSRS